MASRIHTLEYETRVPAPLEEVFAFFSEAQNLQRLTPKSLHFEILTPLPIAMGPKVLIDYRLRLLGIPFKWQTEITVWEPGMRFMDVQRKGPYMLWEHEHLFEADREFTKMTDKLRYAVPGGPLAPLITSLFVKKRVEEIFSFRNEAILSIFPHPAPDRTPDP